MGVSKTKKTSQPEGAPEPMAVDAADDTAAAQEDKLANDQATRLQDLAKKVEQFVGGKGDLEGAKFEE